MARQTGIIKLTGTIGGVTFYQTKDGDLARSQTSLDANRVKRDPKFERTRENGAELGLASSAGRLFRQAFRAGTDPFRDAVLHRRIMSLMMDLRKHDVTSRRGARTPAKGMLTSEGVRALKGFEFHSTNFLGSVLLTQPTVDGTNGIISFKDFVPEDDLVFPPKATHVSLTCHYALIDFEHDKHRSSKSLPVLLSRDPIARDIELIPQKILHGEGVRIVALKVDFFRKPGDELYAIKAGGSFMRIV